MKALKKEAELSQKAVGTFLVDVRQIKPVPNMLAPAFFSDTSCSHFLHDQAQSSATPPPIHKSFLHKTLFHSVQANR
jgi:hypothetical protein